jgi:hypothetical protein
MTVMLDVTGVPAAIAEPMQQRLQPFGASEKVNKISRQRLDLP